jgi:hypothetical protein
MHNYMNMNQEVAKAIDEQIATHNFMHFNNIDIAALDSGEIILKFASGIIVTCEPKWFSSLKDEEIPLVPFRKPSKQEVVQWFEALQRALTQPTQ